MQVPKDKICITTSRNWKTQHVRASCSAAKKNAQLKIVFDPLIFQFGLCKDPDPGHPPDYMFSLPASDCKIDNLQDFICNAVVRSIASTSMFWLHCKYFT